MKNLILLIFTLATLASKAQTSVYHAFPESGAIWNFEMNVSCPPIFSYSENYSITTTGDTLINSQTYHKLSIPAVVKSHDTTICGGIVPGYKGAFRQDTLSKKVFIVLPSYNTELLLYDFNMQVGDTVQGITAPYFDTVVSIDSVLVNNHYHKRWKLNSDNNIFLIEGVGSTYGLIQPQPGFSIGTFPYYGLSCFSRDGMTLYPNTSVNCELITAVNQPDQVSAFVKIFPNPSNGLFRVDVSNANMKEIQLTDVFGNVILKQGLNNQTELKIEGLAAGAYILTFIDSENRKTNRKIISKP